VRRVQYNGAVIVRPNATLWLIAVVGLGACVQILGDDYRVAKGSGQGAATSTSSGQAGAGGVGAGGAGGHAPCELGAPGACGDGMKCTVVDVVTGQIGCGSAGPRPAFARCESDANCVDGTWCDVPAKVCLPICDVESDCTNSGACIVPGNADNAPIPNLNVCFVNCNPVSGAPCDSSFGPVTCLAGTNGSSCWQSLGIVAGQPCNVQEDCAAGAVCINKTCTRWCTPLGVAPQCKTPEQCIDVGVNINGTDYGVCAP